jgi:hypothetical protein
VYLLAMSRMSSTTMGVVGQPARPFQSRIAACCFDNEIRECYRKLCQTGDQIYGLV